VRRTTENLRRKSAPKICNDRRAMAKHDAMVKNEMIADI